MDNGFRGRTTDLLDTPEKKNSADALVDFLAGIHKGAIVHPVVAVSQVADKITNANPEPKSDWEKPKPGANALGYMIGSALPVAVLALSTRRLVGESALASAAHAAGVGFTYSALLQPSNPESETFWKDRIHNGALSAATFATMAGSAARLDKTGLFAVPSGRTLSGHLGYGALAGAPGGVVHAATDSYLKTGELPTTRDLLSKTVEYAVLGSTLGVLQHSYLSHRNSAPEKFSLDPHKNDAANAKTSLSVWTDSTGSPYKVTVNTSYPLQMTKMTDGKWDARVMSFAPGESNIRLTLAKYKNADFHVLPDSMLLQADSFKILLKGDKNEFAMHYMADGHKAIGSNMRDRYVGEIIDARARLVQVKDQMPFDQMPLRMDRMLQSGRGATTHIDYNREGAVNSITFGSSDLVLRLNRSGEFYDIVRGGVYSSSKFEGRIGVGWTAETGHVLAFQPNSTRAPFAIPSDRLTLLMSERAHKNFFQSHLQGTPSRFGGEFLDRLLITGPNSNIDKIMQSAKFSEVSSGMQFIMRQL